MRVIIVTIVPPFLLPFINGLQLKTIFKIPQHLFLEKRVQNWLIIWLFFVAFSPLFLPVAVSWDCSRIEIAMVTPHINSISDLSNIWPTHFSYLSYDFSSYPNRSNKGSKTPLGTVKGICKSCCKTSRAWILGKSRPNVINSGSFLLLQLCFMSNCRLVDFFLWK